MGRRLLVSLGVVLGLIVCAVVAGAAYTALKSPLLTKPHAQLSPENCSPGPCTNLNGFTIWISNVKVDNDIVRMTVKFKNSSQATHASPSDLLLIDSERRQGGPVTDAPNCKSFTTHNFDNGAVYGPIDLCFRVVNTTPPFTLHWSPQEGSFCCQRDIPIWPT